MEKKNKIVTVSKVVFLFVARKFHLPSEVSLLSPPYLRINENKALKIKYSPLW